MSDDDKSPMNDDNRIAELEAEREILAQAIVAAVQARSGTAWRDAWSTLCALADAVGKGLLR